MTFRRIVTSCAASALLASGLVACASNDKALERRQYVERPVSQLYNEAAALMDKKQYSEAILAFQEVERQYPYTSWARRAMLMTAYAQYQSNFYTESIESARRFVALHPGNESAPYAYYLIAMCYFEQILDVGRDQKTTEDALAALDEVVRRFPETSYARDSRLKMDMTYDQLAGKEMSVGRYYLRQDQHLAAVNRFRRVVDNPKFQTTTHTPEALHRLVEAYLSLGLTEEAQKAAAVLGYNYPGSPWYKATFDVMASRGVAPIGQEEAKKRGWLVRTLDRVF